MTSADDTSPPLSLEARLHVEFPEATLAECRRFVIASRGGDVGTAGAKRRNKPATVVEAEAERALEEYLDWRSCYGMDFESSEKSSEGEKSEENGTPSDDGSSSSEANMTASSDEQDWDRAARKALKITSALKQAKQLQLKQEYKEPVKKKPIQKGVVSYDNIDASVSEGEGSGNQSEDVERPNADVDELGGPSFKAADTLLQPLFVHSDADGQPLMDKLRKRILYVLPARIDRKLATADTYALAIAFYLDGKLDRNEEDKFTVLLDTRAGNGWPNPPAVSMVRFARTVMGVLQAFFPERLERLIVYPIPSAAMVVWGVMKRLFHADMLQKAVAAGGPAARNSPVPRKCIGKYVPEEVIDALEQKRIDCFRPVLDDD